VLVLNTSNHYLRGGGMGGGWGGIDGTPARRVGHASGYALWGQRLDRRKNGPRVGIQRGI
jgi:hypothetical protein